MLNEKRVQQLWDECIDEEITRPTQSTIHLKNIFRLKLLGELAKEGVRNAE